MTAHAVGLCLLQHDGRSTAAAANILDAAPDDLAGDAAQVVDGEGIDATAHVADGDLAAVDLDGAAEVLELDHAALEVHEQAGAQLVLGAGDLLVLQAGEARGQGEGAQLLAHDVDHGGGAAGEARGGDAKEA